MSKKTSNKEATTQKKLTLPTILTYKKSIEVSNGYFYEMFKNEDKAIFNPIVAIENDQRTTKSDFGNEEKTLEGNLQVSHYSELQENIMALHFFVTVNPFDINPHSVNDKVYAEEFKKILKDTFIKENTREVAKRIVWNLINGRVLWRNLDTAFNMNVYIKNVTFESPSLLKDVNSYDYLCTSREKKLEKQNPINTKNPDFDENSIKIQNNSDNLVNLVTETILRKIEDENNFDFLQLEVLITAQKPNKSEIFPSQIIRKTKIEDSKYDFAREYLTKKMSDGKEIVMFSPQKMTNAIYTIDDWYKNKDVNDANFISVHNFGVNLSEYTHYRTNTNNGNAPSIFNILSNLENYKTSGESSYKIPEEISKYVIACMLKGGLFNGKKPNNKSGSESDDIVETE